MRRTVVLLMVVGLGGFAAWSNGAPQAAQPAPPPFNPANFVGTVTPRSATDIRLNRYHFDAGARTNWHSHEAGQVVYVEQGRLRAQETGQQTREFAQGSTFHTAPGVKHWHGSFPGEGVTQVSLSFGTTNWMEKVSDEDYRRR
jgi:quercetin dioxygenase-like cupin family protein